MCENYLIVWSRLVDEGASEAAEVLCRTATGCGAATSPLRDCRRNNIVAARHVLRVKLRKPRITGLHHGRSEQRSLVFRITRGEFARCVACEERVLSHPPLSR